MGGGKERFQHMLFKHPILISNVLNTNNDLKSKWDVIKNYLNLLSSSKSTTEFKSLEKKLSPEITKQKITRKEIMHKLYSLNHDILQIIEKEEDKKQKAMIKILSSWPQYISSYS